MKLNHHKFNLFVASTTLCAFTFAPISQALSHEPTHQCVKANEASTEASCPEYFSLNAEGSHCTKPGKSGVWTKNRHPAGKWEVTHNTNNWEYITRPGKDTYKKKNKNKYLDIACSRNTVFASFDYGTHKVDFEGNQDWCAVWSPPQSAETVEAMCPSGFQLTEITDDPVIIGSLEELTGVLATEILSAEGVIVFLDNDGDGYKGDTDCDDANAAIHPGAEEKFGDGKDNDCDGAIDEQGVYTGDLSELSQEPASGSVTDLEVASDDPQGSDEETDVTGGSSTADETSTIVVVTPAGGETYEAGETIDVEWTGGFAAEPVQVNLIDVAANAALNPVLSGLTNDGNEAFVIPDTTASGQYKIYVGQPGGAAAHWGYSNEFSITALPPQTAWTDWLNRDRPSGKGDYDTIGGHLQDGNGCEEPVAVECRLSSSKADWTTSGEEVTCSTDVGARCINAKQSDGRCQDYEVRFSCPVP